MRAKTGGTLLWWYRRQTVPFHTSNSMQVVPAKRNQIHVTRHKCSLQQPIFLFQLKCCSYDFLIQCRKVTTNVCQSKWCPVVFVKKCETHLKQVRPTQRFVCKCVNVKVTVTFRKPCPFPMNRAKYCQPKTVGRRRAWFLEFHWKPSASLFPGQLAKKSGSPTGRMWQKLNTFARRKMVLLTQQQQQQLQDQHTHVRSTFSMKLLVTMVIIAVAPTFV